MNIEIKDINPEDVCRKITETGYFTVVVDGKEYEIEYCHQETYDTQFSDYENDTTLEIPEELDEHREEIEDLFQEAYNDKN